MLARAVLIPIALVAIPLVRLLAGWLIVFLLLAAFGGYLMAQQTGAATDWLNVAGTLLAIGLLRWLRAALLRAEYTLLD